MIVSFDPGATTGVVVADYISSADGFEVVRAFEMTWEQRFAITYELLARRDLTAIVVEDFFLYHHKMESQVGNRFPSVQVIGIIEAYAWINHVHQLIHYQVASLRTRVAILPQHSTIIRKSPHTTSAYQHLRYFLVTSPTFHDHIKRKSSTESSTQTS